MVYNIAETLPNLINPFWMLPLLGILGLRAKDLIGYTAIQFVIHPPVALLLAALFMATFDYKPPVSPDGLRVSRSAGRSCFNGGPRNATPHLTPKALSSD